MNICMVSEYFPESDWVEIRGGVEARAYHLAKELSRQHDVTVVTSSEHTRQKQYQLGRINVIVCSKHCYTHHGAFFSRLAFAWHAYRTWKLLERRQIDVVDGSNFISYLPAYFLARRLKAKAVATYHEVWLGEWVRNKGMLTGLLGGMWEWIVLHLPWDRIIAVSHYTAQKLRYFLPEESIRQVSNGVSLELYTHTKKKFPHPTICCISRLTPQKRIDDLLHALAIVQEEIPTIHCKIIGVGAELGKLRNLVKQLALQHVEFLGFVRKHEDVVQILQQSTVLCHPSIVEGFGIVVLEAMASGVPYVCTDIPVLQEITSNGKGGLLARQKDPQNLAAQLLALLQDADLCKRKANEGKSFVRQYAWSHQAARVATIYTEVVA